LNGIQEVGGSIPPGSTKEIKGLAERLAPFSLSLCGFCAVGYFCCGANPPLPELSLPASVGFTSPFGICD
jgi:hypothetical protein